MYYPGLKARGIQDRPLGEGIMIDMQFNFIKSDYVIILYQLSPALLKIGVGNGNYI
jgi:hypothetical protein